MKEICKPTAYNLNKTPPQVFQSQIFFIECTHTEDINAQPKGDVDGFVVFTFYLQEDAFKKLLHYLAVLPLCSNSSKNT